MANKLATTVYITDHQQQLLKELNKRSKVPVAEYIREGIDMVLGRYQDLLPESQGREIHPAVSKELGQNNEQ